MLRFIKHTLTSISGVEIFPLISLLIFVLFFVAITYRAIRMKKDEVSEISDYPLTDDQDVKF